MTARVALVAPERMQGVAAASTVKALDTWYAGCKFRSRTEARLAVFLDALNVPWAYEEQGYVIAGLGPYLPDFKVARWDAFIEVKGQEPTDWERSVLASVAQAFGSWGLISVGVPQQSGWLEVVAAPSYLDGAHYEGPGWFIAADRRDHQVYWLVRNPGEGHNYEDCVVLDVPKTDHDRWPIVDADMLAAYEAAQSARFEHGENGATA